MSFNNTYLEPFCTLYVKIVDTHEPGICLHYKPLCDSTQIVPHCDTIHDCNMKGPSYFQARQIGKFDVIQNHVGRALLFTFIWCHTLHGCLRQSDKHCVTRARLRNNKREGGRVLTPGSKSAVCTQRKKKSECVSLDRGTCAAGRELSGTHCQS